jgi:hypothetical protein
MLYEHNIKNKHIKLLAVICLLSLSNQTFAGGLITQNSTHQKSSQVVFEHGQFFIVPVENSTKALKVHHKRLKANVPNSMSTSGANHAPQRGHIYLSINITNKE